MRTDRFVVTPPAEDVVMARQLSLIDTPKDWRLTDETKEIARRGLAEARAALAAGRDRPHQRPAA
jgi:hypothetical protein